MAINRQNLMQSRASGPGLLAWRGEQVCDFSKAFALSKESTGFTKGIVDRDAAAPHLAVHPVVEVHAKAGEKTMIPLDVAASVSDRDGSESLSVLVRHLPAAVTLSAGRRDAAGNWVLKPDHLDGVALVLPPGFNQDLKLAITAKATEKTSGDIATVTHSLDVTVTPETPADPQVEAKLPEGIIRPVGLPQADAPGDIVGLRLENASSTAQAAGLVSFGQAFAPGDLPEGQSLTAIVDGHEVPVQVDVKATNPDGSVRHAILTLETPELAVGAHVDALLRAGDPAPAGAALAPADLLARGLDLSVDLALHENGEVLNHHIDAAAVLAQAVEAGTVETWMAGPQAGEFRVTAPVDDHLNVTFDIRAYADGTVRTDVILASETAYAPGNRDHTYDVTVNDGDRVAFQREGLEHGHNTRWHTEVWHGPAPQLNVQHDVNYLVRSGAVPSFDTSTGVRDDVIAGNLDELKAAKTGPMDPAMLRQYMPDVGGRDDIGITTAWGARALLSQDARAEQIMLANADATGGVPWHYRDEVTGQYVRVDQHPDLWLDPRGDWEQFGQDRLPTPFDYGNAGWETDTSHQPAANYLPYLLTGSHYHLDGLHAQTAYSLASYNPGDRGQGEGSLDLEQVRGRAWSLRNLGDSAYITPDGHALKGYFSDTLNGNLENLVRKYTEDGAFDHFGKIEGFFLYDMFDAGDMAPWMNDFMAITLNSLHQRGFEGADRIIGWMDNFLSGRFLHGDDGFDPRFGATYNLFVHGPDFGKPYATWAETFKRTFGDQPTLEHSIDGNPQEPADYAAVARASMASVISATGSANATEAYGYLTKFLVLEGGAARFAENPTWNIAPRLADGSYLTLDHTIVFKDKLAHVQAGGNAADLIHGGEGADKLDGGGGIDLLYGDQGDDHLKGGAAGDFLYGGLGRDRLEGGEGGDYLKGHKGADTFVLDGYGDDRIADFKIGEDRLAIRAGAGLPTAQHLIDTATAHEGGGTVLHLGPHATVVLDGVSVDHLTASMFQTG